MHSCCLYTLNLLSCHHPSNNNQKKWQHEDSTRSRAWDNLWKKSVLSSCATRERVDNRYTLTNIHRYIHTSIFTTITCERVFLKCIQYVMYRRYYKAITSQKRIFASWGFWTICFRLAHNTFIKLNQFATCPTTGARIRTEKYFKVYTYLSQ